MSDKRYTIASTAVNYTVLRAQSPALCGIIPAGCNAIDAAVK